MRRMRAIRSVPGIAMSRYGMNEDRPRSREAGFSEHLVKPIDVAQLIATIRWVTDNRSQPTSLSHFVWPNSPSETIFPDV
jgi:CheY-like chemotaxis protein